MDKIELSMKAKRICVEENKVCTCAKKMMPACIRYVLKAEKESDYLQAFNAAQRANSEGYWDVSDAEVLQARWRNVAEIWRGNVRQFPDHADDIRLFADFADAMAKKMERKK